MIVAVRLIFPSHVSSAVEAALRQGVGPELAEYEPSAFELEIVLGLIAPRGFKSRILRSDQLKRRGRRALPLRVLPVPVAFERLDHRGHRGGRPTVRIPDRKLDGPTITPPLCRVWALHVVATATPVPTAAPAAATCALAGLAGRAGPVDPVVRAVRASLMIWRIRCRFCSLTNNATLATLVSSLIITRLYSGCADTTPGPHQPDEY
jgi:hypothetical protein